MKSYILSLLFLSLLALPTSAQERTAASSLESQISWTALSNQIKAASDKTDMVGARVDQITVCGKQGKAYAPGQPESDAQGCRDANQVSQINNNLNNIYTCNRAGHVYDGTRCIEAVNKPNIITTGTNTCPGGYTLIGCSGVNGSFASMNGNQCNGYTVKYTTGRGYYGSSSNERYEDSYISLVNAGATATCVKN